MDLTEHLLSIRHRVLYQQTLIEAALQDIDGALETLRGAEEDKADHPGKTLVTEAIVIAIARGNGTPRSIHSHLKMIGQKTTISSIRTLISRLHASGRIARDASGWIVA